ncbi:MAG: integrase core domain-containing protein, partial [Sulfurimonas sp.]
MDLDDLVDCVSQNIPKANRSNVYRTLRASRISQVPKEQKAKAKKCKEYFPFYITHVLKFDVECTKENIEHRLTAPATPKTNGMVERVNGTIKNSTIKATEYKNIEELKEDLNKFLIYYNTNRKHGGLKRELKVRTPCEALRSWFEIEPEIFKISPD